MKNKNILILLFLLISSNIFAQKAKPVLHQVTGTIYNEINLLPENRSIPFVQVQVEKAQLPFQTWRIKEDKLEY
jgi:hypothetical protein